MRLQPGAVQGYDFNRMVVAFTILDLRRVIRCAISSAAPDSRETA